MGDERNDYGGTGYRHGGSSSGGYGTGNAAADHEDVVGRRPLSAKEVFPEDLRGCGPRGYVRSDERIPDVLHERLAAGPGLDASGIELSVEGGARSRSGAPSRPAPGRRVSKLRSAP